MLVTPQEYEEAEALEAVIRQNQADFGPDPIWAGEVGYSESYGDFNPIGTAKVKNINLETKTVTVESVGPVNAAQAIDATMARIDDSGVAPLEGATKAADTVSFTEEEQALARFMYLMPYVKKFASAMGAKSVVRVMHQLAQHPLSEVAPKFKNKQEEELFNIMQEIQAAKSIVIRNILTKQKEAAEAAGVVNATEEA